MYELTVDIDDCVSNDEVIVRAWIDHLHSGELTSEVELELSRQGVNKWRAVFDVPVENDDADAFAYRVGLVARPGAAWSLRIRECKTAETSRTLIEDGDVLTMKKEWLLGTCESSR